MKYLALSLAFLWPSIAAACNTSQGESPLFTCETTRAGTYISICATETEPGVAWSQVQYRFGTADKDELVYPADAKQGARKLLFSHAKTAHSYTVSIRFRNGSYAYRVFSIAKWEGDEPPAEAMDGDAGVEVRSKSGKLVSIIHCGERPYMFPEYLREALACDMDNPHGRKGCAKAPPLER